MKLGLQFGAFEPQRIVNWSSPIKDFPSLVIYKDKKWEFVIYDLDQTGQTSWICNFSEVQSYDPNYYATTYVNVEYMFTTAGCQCGSAHGGGHMFFCPKWTKF